MRRSRHALVALLLALCVPAALGGLFGGSKAKGGASGDGEVLVVSGAESFDAAVKAHSFLLVEFYAPVRGRAGPGPWRYTRSALPSPPASGPVRRPTTRPVLRTTPAPRPSPALREAALRGE